MDEYIKAAYKAACWIVCPWCDEKKCVGRFDCPDIKAWIDEKKKEQGADT